MDFDAPAPSDDRLPAGTRIGRAALRVADLDETTAFYRDVVGLAVLDRDDDRATLGVDGTILLVLDRDPDRPGGVGPTPASFTPRSAFPHAPRSAGLARVRERGGSTALPTTSSARRCTSTIPKATAWIYRDRPAEWPVDDDGTVQMATEPLDIEGVSGRREERTPTATSSTASRPAPTWVTCISKSPRCRRSRRYVDGLGFESRSG